MSPTIHALVLAVLLALPLIGWLLQFSVKPGTSPDVTADPALTSTAGLSPTDLPFAGAIAALVGAYVLPREHPAAAVLLNGGGISWIVAVSLLGTALVARVTRRHPVIPPTSLGLAISAFAAWMAISLTAAVVGDRIDAGTLARTTRYLQSLGLFLVVAYRRPRLGGMRTILLALLAALTIRGGLLTEHWFRDQNLSMLLAIGASVALAVSLRPPLAAGIVLGAWGLAAAAMVLAIQNRGGIVGLGAALVTLAIGARPRGRVLATGAALTACVLVWAVQAGYLDRFGEIYANGHFLDTAAQRLDTWHGGLQTARANWLFGVGPGNFDNAFPLYVENGGLRFAHNSVIEVLAETGLIGLALYAGVFVTAARALWRVIRTSTEWPRSAALGLLAALAAHLASGMFQSNPSLLLTSALLGIAAGLPGGNRTS